MKILVTADLHFDVPRSRGPARELIARACAEGGEAIVLVGDTAGADLDTLAEALGLLAGFDGVKLMVPGNHCLWCRGDQTSMDRYERLLPEVAKQCGFELLDHNPAVMGGVGLVGSIGWYDYSFADESLGIPLEFYEAKVAPGAAARLPEHARLLRRYRDRLTDRQLAIQTRWMDGTRVRLGMSDRAFCEFLADKLARQLEELSGKVERIVAFVHHLPFREIAPKGRPDHFAFAAAYMGTGLIGEVLLACPKVTHVYCGHSHWHGRRRIKHLEAINVGSTYTDKRLEVLVV